MIVVLWHHVVVQCAETVHRRGHLEDAGHPVLRQGLEAAVMVEAEHGKVVEVALDLARVIDVVPHIPNETGDGYELARCEVLHRLVVVEEDQSKFLVHALLGNLVERIVVEAAVVTLHAATPSLDVEVETPHGSEPLNLLVRARHAEVGVSRSPKDEMLHLLGHNFLLRCRIGCGQVGGSIVRDRS